MTELLQKGRKNVRKKQQKKERWEIINRRNQRIDERRKNVERKIQENEQG